MTSRYGAIQLVGLVTGLMCTTASVEAKNVVWKGGGSSDNWSDSNNWEGGSFADGDDVRIDDTRTTDKVTLDKTIAPGRMTFDFTGSFSLFNGQTTTLSGSTVGPIEKKVLALCFLRVRRTNASAPCR